MSTRTGKI